MSVLIAPSLLASDFASLSTEIAAAERGGADLLHIDIMDGHFVPNLTMGPPVVKAIKRVAKVPLDVHLMIEDPDRFVEAFVEAGASMISVHAEVLLSPAPHAALREEPGGQGWRGDQSGDARGRARGGRGGRRPRARDDGEPRVRRPDFHPQKRV